MNQRRLIPGVATSSILRPGCCFEGCGRRRCVTSVALWAARTRFSSICAGFCGKPASWNTSDLTSASMGVSLRSQCSSGRQATSGICFSSKSSALGRTPKSGSLRFPMVPGGPGGPARKRPKCREFQEVQAVHPPPGAPRGGPRAYRANCRKFQAVQGNAPTPPNSNHTHICGLKPYSTPKAIELKRIYYQLCHPQTRSGCF